MAQYNYKGKKITLDDALVKKYDDVFCGMESMEHAIERLLYTDDDEWLNMSDKDVSDIVTHALSLEIRSMG
jgi:hypothetical protein